MELELKHLAPYLPYGLKVKLSDGEIKEVVGLREWIGWCIVYKSKYGEVNTPIKGIKPILRPLSDLTKEIEYNKEKFVPIDYFLGEDVDLVENAVQINDLSYLPYNIVQKLLEWHFDVFGLIEKGLAIDFNTVN